MNRTNTHHNTRHKLLPHFSAQFTKLGTVLRPDHRSVDREGVLNPACTRMRNGTLKLYPRMVALGNVSRIGRFRINEHSGGKLTLVQHGFALEPEAPYEIRHGCDGYGCEDPRVTYVAALDRYVMAYVAFGPRGPEVAVAVSTDAITWRRLGLMHFRNPGSRFADKDAAFFPEPVLSPSGVESLALYHRPTLWALWQDKGKAAAHVLRRSREQREGIALAYVPLEPVRKDVTNICAVTETRRLPLDLTAWGQVKVGGGTPPVRIREGWLSVIHGVDILPHKNGETRLRYSAGIVVHSDREPHHILYRSPEPLFVPELPEEVNAEVGQVVFPTGIDPRPDVGDRVFDIYYGMGDRAVGRGRLSLSP